MSIWLSVCCCSSSWSSKCSAVLRRNHPPSSLSLSLCACVYRCIAHGIPRAGASLLLLLLLLRVQEHYRYITNQPIHITYLGPIPSLIRDGLVVVADRHDVRVRAVQCSASLFSFFSHRLHLPSPCASHLSHGNKPDELRSLMNPRGDGLDIERHCPCR